MCGICDKIPQYKYTKQTKRGIKAKNELQKRKDSLLNAAWEAARKVRY